MLKKFIISASAMTLAACAFPTITLAQAPEYAAELPEYDTQETAAEAAGPAMWLVTDEDTTIYLFGTVHFLPEGLDWYRPEIQAALESSDQFVSEIDTSALPQAVEGEAPPPELMAIAQMQMQLAQLTTGGTMRDLMTEEDRAQYEEVLAGFGIPAQAFDGFEPWFAIITLGQLGLLQAGLDPSTGVERVLDGLVEGKDRAAFETVEQQFNFFDSIPMESQLAMLDASVEAMPEMADGMTSMIDDWMAGDADALAETINEEMSDPAIFQILLADRNANWAEWIDTRMDEPGTVFIAVGAGHLAGEDSVQDFLEERGLTAELVQY